MIFSRVYLLLGSVIKILEIKSLEKAGTNLGIAYYPAIIFLYNTLVDLSSKGRYPQIQANIITPVLINYYYYSYYICLNLVILPPNVYLKSVISLSSNHFGGSIARGPTGSFEGFSGLVSVRKPEIYDFNIFISIKKQIFRF